VPSILEAPLLSWRDETLFKATTSWIIPVKHSLPYNFMEKWIWWGLIKGWGESGWKVPTFSRWEPAFFHHSAEPKDSVHSQSEGHRGTRVTALVEQIKDSHFLPAKGRCWLEPRSRNQKWSLIDTGKLTLCKASACLLRVLMPSLYTAFPLPLVLVLCIPNPHSGPPLPSEGSRLRGRKTGCGKGGKGCRRAFPLGVLHSRPNFFFQILTDVLYITMSTKVEF
jgi:hypothetical protein